MWTVISASSRVYESDRLRLATTASRLETTPLRLATKHDKSKPRDYDSRLRRLRLATNT
ncbi:hypothetical protein HanPI659440_Chr14g0553281 [Helianthus annuus]|nr:hypothetical protein HanPI659440_Chr14g0553281 [Helianthus annuus]